MKYIAVFLILNLLLLSSFSGIAGIQYGAAKCCKQKTHQDCCKQQKQKSAGDCAKGNCDAMVNCGTCSFIIVQPSSFSPAVVDLQQQAAYPFLIGALSDYYGNGWNPPKA
ncbi:hypothetical protein [Mucilaginibacter gossypii]|uniref:Uncharacterized protein n=1 Tax=Mucilaginibacter gossypii TaxID=551996 RepID=A0A1G7RP16_9SPHI|nr:hypothetical protein [Mucilaginibacter gossypii]SDG12413.1 hypothetical protein SAMN05192573_102305 [Mucilaginibacter gossypii]